MKTMLEYDSRLDPPCISTHPCTPCTPLTDGSRRNAIDNTAWDAPLERLLDDVYAFARTGPREHDDWGRDVLNIMDRSVTDPRGRQALERQIDRAGRENIRPAYPFLPLTAEQVRRWTFPVTAGAAAELLASLTQEWFFEPRPVRARADRDDVLADACSVLSRFGADADFRTSSDLARTCASPDFLAGELVGGHPFTDHVMDLGLLAVSTDEVGVFWSFNAN
ncbi:hypothetical protein [Streptomyces sp. NPDC088180]|uniref:hypothetical protein n=1 Tax=Streptomyces sp. NPDC088180 TaxID=3365837 RepID=UPI0038179200